MLPLPGELPDRGRIDGVRKALIDPFNCQGEFSDDPRHECPELRFARTGAELLGAMRTPSLRSLPLTAPFMHKGQLATLRKVIEHYNLAAPALIGHNEAKPLRLSRREIAELEAFLISLSAPAD
jgi:cytochrome c peroxidase